MFESNSSVSILSKKDSENLVRIQSELSPLDAKVLTKLKSAKVVDDHLYPQDAATVGSQVTLKDLGTGSVTQLILSDKSLHSSGTKSCPQVSVASPLGITLLGMRKGEDIKWTLPNGHSRYLRISAVTTP